MKSHLKGEGNFNYSGCNYDIFCLYSIDKDFINYSFGKRDWAPVSVIIGMTYARAWLTDRVARRLYIDSDSEIIRDWKSANESLIDKAIDAYKERSIVGFPEEMKESYNEYFADIPDDEIEERVMIYTQFPRMSMEYLRIMGIAYPVDISGFSSAGGPPMIGRYYRSQVHTNLNDAIEKAEESAIKFSLAWFKNQGFDVDNGKYLVKLPGYEPLFYRGR